MHCTFVMGRRCEVGLDLDAGVTRRLVLFVLEAPTYEYLCFPTCHSTAVSSVTAIATALSTTVELRVRLVIQHFWIVTTCI